MNEEMLGVFYNSFHLSNYEWSTKTAPEPKENTDERLNKYTKKIDHFNLSSPEEVSTTF